MVDVAVCLINSLYVHPAVVLRIDLYLVCQTQTVFDRQDID
jgi:hypothetical protein